MSPKSRSLVATILLIGCVVLLVKRGVLIASTPAGLVLQGVGIALMLWARLTFGRRSFHATADPTAGGLVTAGPYRYWRHPIYAAVLLIMWTGVLARGTAPMLLDLAIAALATAMTMVRVQAEEQLLRASMPEYAGYAARTKRFIPYVF